MVDDRTEELVEVVRHDERPTVHERPAASRALEREARAHRGSELDEVERTRRSHELDTPAAQQRVDIDLLDCGAQHPDLVAVDDRPEAREWVSLALPLEDEDLLVERRIAEGGAQEETVELRLGQGERAFLLDRVLGRDQEERIGKPTAGSVDGHLKLRHALEQCGLRLWQGPVDLVDEDDVREDRPGPELELPRLRAPDREAGDVRRLQVRRALDPGG